jgi:hypothetical protein
MTIKTNDPVREDFSAKSTGNWDGTVRTGYYETKGGAVRAYQSALEGYALNFDPDGLIDLPGNHGRVEIDVHNHMNDCVSHAIIMWHKRKR